jgi:hypothetical protein
MGVFKDNDLWYFLDETGKRSHGYHTEIAAEATEDQYYDHLRAGAPCKFLLPTEEPHNDTQRLRAHCS